ncbi:hypothetical protein F4810DRAFT_631282 [Camillea tinctor]|nr:hypothetical protein F4810DRAFT_631282 [Camillea tinctor]
MHRGISFLPRYLIIPSPACCIIGYYDILYIPIAKRRVVFTCNRHTHTRNINIPSPRSWKSKYTNEEGRSEYLFTEKKTFTAPHGTKTLISYFSDFSFSESQLTQNIRHPVRSALDKLGTARSVVGSVTTSESLVFALHLPSTPSASIHTAIAILPGKSVAQKRQSY